MGEFPVLKGPDVVLHAVEFRVGDGAEVAEGQVDAHEEGRDEADEESQERGPQEDGEIALDGFFHGWRKPPSQVDGPLDRRDKSRVKRHGAPPASPRRERRGGRFPVRPGMALSLT